MKLLIEFITETGQKRKLSTFWRWEVQTENYNNKDFYSYLQKNDLIHTY